MNAAQSRAARSGRPPAAAASLPLALRVAAELAVARPATALAALADELLLGRDEPAIGHTPVWPTSTGTGQTVTRHGSTTSWR